MRALAIVFVFMVSGCVSGLDYERLRDDNTALRQENDALRRRLVRNATKPPVRSRVPSSRHHVHGPWSSPRTNLPVAFWPPVRR